MTPDVLINKRPEETDDRAIPGHHEGDLIIGTDRSAIGTIVERTTGYTTLVHLPREQGWRAQPITKTGPALSGYGAISMNKASAQALASMPTELKRSLTWGRGKEMSAHTQFTIDTGLKVYFADPHRPWQRGTNENMNGQLTNTFRREPISCDGTQTISRQSHTLSTPDRVSDSNGEPPPKYVTNTYKSIQQQRVASTS